MGKRFFESLGTVSLGISLLLILTAFFAVYVYGGDVQGGESRELNIDMVPPEVYDFTSIYSMFSYQQATKYNTATEGTFSVESSQSRYKNRMSGTITIYNVDYLDQYDEIYEAWLVDFDTGYQLSLGLFIVDQDGYGKFSYSTESYVNAYDAVVVTKEEYPDEDPRASGDVVLVGYFDTTQLTKTTVSTGTGSTLDEYADYGEEADSVYG